MEPRLVPINAFIGMCTPGGLWPSPLAEAGFRLAGLEVPITTPSGSTTLDGVAFNEDLNIALVCEGKSGANVEVDQATRLSEIDGPTLIQGVPLTIRKHGELVAEVAYVCLEQNQERILKGLRMAKYAPAVLVLGQQTITHAGGAFRSPVLEETFATPIPVTGLVPRMIRVDELSPDGEFDALVRASLVAAMSQQLPNVGLASLVESVIPHHPIYGAKARHALRRKVQVAARRVADSMPGYLRFHPADGGHDAAWVEILQSPEEADPRGRTQRWQAVTRATGAQPRSQKYVDPNAVQLPFDEMMSELTAGEEPAQTTDDQGEAT